jgi:hypothetical protein
MMAKDKVDAVFSDVVQLSYAIQHRLQSDPDIAGDYSLDLGTLWCNPDDHPFIPDIPAFLEARRAEWQPPDEQVSNAGGFAGKGSRSTPRQQGLGVPLSAAECRWMVGGT